MDFILSITYSALRFFLGLVVAGMASNLLTDSTRTIYWSLRRVLRLNSAFPTVGGFLICAGVVLVTRIFATEFVDRTCQTWSFRFGALAGVAYGVYYLFGAGEPLSRFWLNASAHLNRGVPENIAFLCDRLARGAIANISEKREQDAEKYFKRIFEIADESVATRSITSALLPASAPIRHNAAFALGSLGDARGLAPLFVLLDDPDSGVRQSAADALGMVGDIRAVEPLAARLQDHDPYVSDRATAALGKIGEPALEHLLLALRKSSTGETAARELKRIGSREAVGPLIKAVESEPFLRNAALEALDSIDPAWTRSETAHAAVPALIRDLSDQYRYRGAGEALAKIAPDWVKSDAGSHGVQTLIGCLTQAREEEQIRKILDGIDPDWIHSESVKQAVPDLMHDALFSGDPNLCFRAADLICEIDDPIAIKVLLHAATVDERLWVREALTRALRRHSKSEALIGDPTPHKEHAGYGSEDFLKQAHAGELQCPKCGAAGVSLQDVRIGKEAGKPYLDPGASGKCGKCGARLSLDRLPEAAAAHLIKHSEERNMSQGGLVPTPGQKGHCQMCGRAGIPFQVMADRAFFLCSKDCENKYGNLRSQALRLGQVNVTIDTTGTGIGDYVRAERQSAFDSDSYCWYCGTSKKMGDNNCSACGAQADVPLKQ